MSEENNITNQAEEVSTDSPDQERTPRGTDSREATQHTPSWENVSNLPAPNPQEGWVFRYIRTCLLYTSDAADE